VTQYLSVSEILFIHSVIIDETGGSHGVRDLGLIESAAATCQQTFGGKDLYRNLEGKGAALFCSLLKNHPFVDGNKRTAVTALAVMLDLNGATLVADPNALTRWVLQAAAAPLNPVKCAKWIRTHSEKNRR